MALTIEVLLEGEVAAVAVTDEFPIEPGEERNFEIPLPFLYDLVCLRVLVSTSASDTYEFLLYLSSDNLSV